MLSGEIAWMSWQPLDLLHFIQHKGKEKRGARALLCIVVKTVDEVLCETWSSNEIQFANSWVNFGLLLWLASWCEFPPPVPCPLMFVPCESMVVKCFPLMSSWCYSCLYCSEKMIIYLCRHRWVAQLLFFACLNYSNWHSIKSHVTACRHLAARATRKEW